MTNKAPTNKAPFPKHIVLVGMMGCGKSAIGEALAKALKLSLNDSDKIIESEVGASIADIFKYQGEDYFREKERHIIQQILEGETSVLASGGGAFCQAEIRALCQKHATSVYLETPVKVLWQRIAGNKNKPSAERPLARAGYDNFAALLESRQADYRQADIIIACEGKSQKHITREITDLLKT